MYFVLSTWATHKLWIPSSTHPDVLKFTGLFLYYKTIKKKEFSRLFDLVIVQKPTQKPSTKSLYYTGRQCGWLFPTQMFIIRLFRLQCHLSVLQDSHRVAVRDSDGVSCDDLSAAAAPSLHEWKSHLEAGAGPTHVTLSRTKTQNKESQHVRYPSQENHCNSIRTHTEDCYDDTLEILVYS